MFLINIKGLGNGKHKIELNPQRLENDKFPEISNDIIISGSLDILDERIIFNGKVKTELNLVCDLSLENYNETIDFDFKINVVQSSNESDINDLNSITMKDENSFDITDYILQEIAVRIPMKKVSPKHKNKNINDIYPELNKETTPNNNWEKLKNLKLN